MTRTEFEAIGHQVIGASHPRLVRDKAAHQFDFVIQLMSVEECRQFWMQMQAQAGNHLEVAA
jgi:hypothetical protein